MNGFHRVQRDYARQQTNRISSMLSLVEGALRLEEDFQDKHDARPVRGDGDPFIPTLGEVIDTLVVCQDVLNELWSDLGKGDFE